MFRYRRYARWRAGMAALAGAAVMSNGVGQVNAQTTANHLQPGDFDFTLMVGSYARHYALHIPTSYNPTTPVPLVIMLHGAGGSGQGALRDDNWITESEKGGFIVAGPDALPNKPNRPANLLINPTLWREGSGRGSLAGQDVDDVAFINALIDDVISKTAIDPDRIYVTGHSSGAGMAYTLGVQLSDRLAAVAPVSGHLWLSDPLTLQYPVSLILFDGSLDPLNPPDGGTVKMPWGGYQTKPPIHQSFDRWAKLLNCPANTTTIYNQNGVTGIAYSRCDSGSEAQYYLINGMGHVWPSGVNRLPVRLVGPSSDAINASDVIWAFFQQHPRPNATQ